MQKRILFISNTANFSKFNRPFMLWFKQQGWQVDYVSAGEEQILDCDNQYTICMKRSPFNLANIKAYTELKDILLTNDYDIIHCHTPMGGFLGRLTAKNIGVRAKVIYTAHGFHFYKRAPITNWLVYYPIEKYLAKYTDCLITINHEDFNLAKNKFNAKEIFHIDGVGIDTTKFYPASFVEKNNLRKEYGYTSNDFILLYIAEFIPRKNHALLLKQIPVLKKAVPNLIIILVGNGRLMKRIKRTAEASKIANFIDFMGYRNDIDIICRFVDVYVTPSKQEGFTISVLEAMASGLPLVCSKIRGHIDIMHNNRNGFLFSIESPNEMVNAIIEMYRNQELRKEIAENNIQDVKRFVIDLSLKKMIDIYLPPL